jgi:hypothetical protein
LEPVRSTCLFFCIGDKPAITLNPEVFGEFPADRKNSLSNLNSILGDIVPDGTTNAFKNPLWSPTGGFGPPFPLSSDPENPPFPKTPLDVNPTRRGEVPVFVTTKNRVRRGNFISIGVVVVTSIAVDAVQYGSADIWYAGGYPIPIV